MLLVLIGILVLANLNAHQLLFGVLVWLLVINNKVLLQWGRFNFTTTDFTLNFPTSYSSVNYSICLTDRWMNPSTDYVKQAVSYALITTNMTTTYCRILTNVASQDTTWMSIGF